MVIKYVGRTTDFKGKTLWEILGNLKNFGVGRMVIRNMFQRYPEPSYMRIVKVAALHDTGKPVEEDPRKVVALVERTFRGVKAPKLVQIEASSYKADYILIPKDEEERFLSSTLKLPSKKVLPQTCEFPPLLKELLIREAISAGSPLKQEPELKLKYNFKGVNNYRLANDNEKPTKKVTVSLGEPASPSLYADLKQEHIS